MEETTLSGNLEIIKNAVDTIRTTLDMPTEDIQTVADAVEVPSGSISITANNTYDVTNYASAIVNVPSGGADYSSNEGFAQWLITQAPVQDVTMDTVKIHSVPYKVNKIYEFNSNTGAFREMEEDSLTYMITYKQGPLKPVYIALEDSTTHQYYMSSSWAYGGQSQMTLTVPMSILPVNANQWRYIQATQNMAPTVTASTIDPNGGTATVQFEEWTGSVNNEGNIIYKRISGNSIDDLTNMYEAHVVALDEQNQTYEVVGFIDYWDYEQTGGQSFYQIERWYNTTNSAAPVFFVMGTYPFDYNQAADYYHNYVTITHNEA